jgi:hypothetical protein
MIRILFFIRCFLFVRRFYGFILRDGITFFIFIELFVRSFGRFHWCWVKGFFMVVIILGHCD